MIEIKYCSIGHSFYKVIDGENKKVWKENQPDKDGSVSVRCHLINYGEKAVKYAYITFTPYNAVGDTVTCEKSGLSSNTVKATGPFYPYEPNNRSFENVWYSNSIKSIGIDNVEVEYMDGTTESVKGNYRPSSGEKRRKVWWDILDFLWLLLKPVLKIGIIILLLIFLKSCILHR